MTMHIKITNAGPEPYVAVVTRVYEQADVVLAELKVGESTEQSAWVGAHLEVKEKVNP